MPQIHQSLWTWPSAHASDADAPAGTFIQDFFTSRTLAAGRLDNLRLVPAASTSESALPRVQVRCHLTAGRFSISHQYDKLCHLRCFSFTSSTLPPAFLSTSLSPPPASSVSDEKRCNRIYCLSPSTSTTDVIPSQHAWRAGMRKQK